MRRNKILILKLLLLSQLNWVITLFNSNNIVSNDYESTLEEEKNRIFIYIADELGFIKVWDLTYIIEEKLKFKKAPNYP